MRTLVGSIVVLGCGSKAAPAPAPTPGPGPAPLASEKLYGQVLVPSRLPLHARAEGARREPGSAAGTAMAVKVLGEHGDTVEVQTGPLDDCVEQFGRPYELNVFVRRDQLIPRAKRAVSASYPDGTGVVVDRGAPIVIGDQGPTWENRTLAATPLAPTADLLVYSTLPLTAPTALPPAGGPRMVCEGGEPVTEAAYRARSDEGSEGYKMERGEWIAWCGISDGTTRYPSPATPVPRPVLDGTPMEWPAGGDAYAWVSLVADRFLADVEVGCGRIRYVVHRAALDGTGRLGGILGGVGVPVDMWKPVAGPVTWPDGSPAGRYLGDYERYEHATDVGDRFCVEIPGIAERVCHPKSTSQRVQGSPGSGDD